MFLARFIVGILILKPGSTGKIATSYNISTTLDTSTATSDNGSTTKFDHIILIVLENKSYSQIVGNSQAPYFNNLAKTYTLIPNYYGIAHPSLPNYIALIGGSTFGITTDCTDCFVSKTNLIDNLEKSGYSWKAYMESMPQSCYVGNAGLYAQKHNPFIYFSDIKNDTAKCSNIVPYSELSNDLASGSALNSTPNFIWITPNLCNDMHDCSVKTGDKWLSEQVPTILNSQAFKNQNSLLAVFWEEDNGTKENHVPLILVASKTKVVYNPQDVYTHYSLLHTVETLWNLPTLSNNDKNAAVFGFIDANK